MCRGVPALVVFGLTFGLTLTARVWNIHHEFWLLRDQIRDWGIALRPFHELPLVGPATHVGGYTIGPAFYWLLWGIRVTVGPWFDYLPHGGGIGQAILHSAADVLLLYAVWRRTQSIWIALLTATLVAFAAFDLSFAALVWNPMAGTTLAKASIALVLLDWHRATAWRAAALVAVAWCAVHAYTGAVFVTLGVLVAALADPLVRGERVRATRNVALAIAVVALLQVPYLVHQVKHRFDAPVMAAVSGSVARILRGEESPQVQKSIRGYVAAVQFIETAPRTVPGVGWLLLICGAVVAVRYARDVAVLSVTLLPQLATVAGYALFLDDLDTYYYLPVMPAAVLTVVLAILACPSPRVRTVAAATAFVVVLLTVPAKVRLAHSMNRMPEYRILVEASRRIRAVPEPMRAIQADFRLPPTASTTFIYEILGGRIDRASPWVSVISRDGTVLFRKTDRP
jgi:hypothetical protein